MTLRLTILISHTTAAPLNLGIQKLSALLIVHTLLGQDHFLSFSGEYGATLPTLPAERKVIIRVIAEPSCFGTNLSALARLPGPIRELRRVEDLLPEAQARNSSREFMKLMGWLMSHDVGAIVRPTVPAWHGDHGAMVIPFSPIYSSHRETKA
jgi:inositol polyphosphate 5-phosphatase INPP5B/F